MKTWDVELRKSGGINAGTDTLYSQGHCSKIQDQAITYASCLHLRPAYREKDIFQLFDSLELNQEAAFDQHIQPMLSNLNLPVIDLDGLLSFETDAAGTQLYAERTFVDCLNEARSQCRVDRNGSLNHAAAKFLVTQFSHFQLS
jgi:hypothetical protein